MSQEKEFNYSTLQNQIQDAEKSFQIKAYELSLDVQKANKAYQKSLSVVDKAYKTAEKAHAESLKDSAKNYASDTKTLTEKAVSDAKQKETKIKEAKQRWAAQQKMIKDGFKDSLDVKKEELKNTEKEKAAKDKELQAEYVAAKDKLQSIKTETTEIFLNAQNPFINSLRYYISRLEDGHADDLKYLKQEIFELKKSLQEIENKESILNKSILKNAENEKASLVENIQKYAKDLQAIAAKIKGAFTRSEKRFDASISGFNDIIKSGTRSLKSVEKKIQEAIINHHESENAFIANPNVTIDTPTLKKIIKELGETNELRHTAYNITYESLFTNIEDLTGYIRSIRDDYKATVKDLMQQHQDVFDALMDEAKLILDTTAWYDQPERVLRHLTVGSQKASLLKFFEASMQPFVSMQKKWHAKLLKAYKESATIYRELDEIQAFYDAFEEEKALAFENEQVHISKKSAQLNIEIEAAKKRYEVAMLSADQNVLFEETKKNYLEKVYIAEKNLEMSRIKSEFDQRKKASQKIINESKTDLALKKAYHDIELSLLSDKQEYHLSREKEAFEIKRLELEKEKNNALYALKVSQNSELDAQAILHHKAQNTLVQVKEEKRQFLLDLDQKYEGLHNDALMAFKRQLDELDLEIKRLNFEEDKELRDIDQVRSDEIMVPRNRLKEFDNALKRRYNAVNKPYKSILKTFEKLDQLTTNPTVTYDSVIAVASNEFKDEILATLDSYYETLKWTREYYSELEVSKIKRSDLNARKQAVEIERHQQSEDRYTKSLDTYLKSARQSAAVVFERFLGRLDKRQFATPKEIIRQAQVLHADTLDILETQTNSVLEEIKSLFDYIKEQDIAFIQEVEYGLETAKVSINNRYLQKREIVETEIQSVKKAMDAKRKEPKNQFDDTENAVIESHNQAILAAEEKIRQLELETVQKKERFKADIQILDNEFAETAENLRLQEARALDDLTIELDGEKARIKEKYEHAKQVYETIKAAEDNALAHHQQVLDYKKATLERIFEDKVRKADDAVADVKREQEREKIEIERILNRDLDQIQKEISSKEIQLDAALEKVNREYDTLYFDKQTRSQSLNERLDVIQKRLFSDKELLLEELKDELGQSNLLAKHLNFTELIEREKTSLVTHRDQIQVHIEAKKAAFQESL